MERSDFHRRGVNDFSVILSSRALGVFWGVLLLIAAPAWGQVNYGEVRVKVSDPSGIAVKATVHLASAGNDYDKSFATDGSGALVVEQVPYGVYRVQVQKAGFAEFSSTLQVHSALPVEEAVRLSLASVVTKVSV